MFPDTFVAGAAQPERYASKRRMAVLLKKSFLCLMLFLSFQVYAEPGTGIDLLRKCEAAKELSVKGELKDVVRYSEAMYCLGLLQGIIDTESIHKIMESEQLLCFKGKGIQVQQAVHIVVKYLNDHPEDLNRNQSLLAISALMAVALCK